MPKKLIVCADGTWNDEDLVRTNVAKLHRALQTWHVEGVNQWVCYVSGVGTTFGEAIRGGAFGYGLSRNILRGYYFLVDNYGPGDQLYFFGFSRGACTVRSLADFIRNSGLVKKQNRNKIDGAWKLYGSRSSKTNPRAEDAQKFRTLYSYEPDIEFIGVWDTVGSLGIPTGTLRLLSLLLHLFGYDGRFQNQLGTTIWKSLGAVAVVIGAVKYLFPFGDQRVKKERLAAGYRMLEHELQCIRVGIKERGAYDAAAKSEFQIALRNKRELIGQSDAIFAKWGGLEKAKDCFPNVVWS